MPSERSMAADSSVKQQLLQRIQDRSAIVGVIGLGYVTLAEAVEFAISRAY